MDERRQGLAERIYGRLGWRLIPALIGGAWLAALAFVAIALVAALVGYMDASATEWLTASAIAAAPITAGVVAAVLIFGRQTRPAIAWLRDRDGRVNAEDAWLAAVWLPRRFVAVTAVVAALGHVPGVVIYCASEFDLGRWQVAGWITCVVVATFAIGAVVLFLIELLLRPAIAEISSALPPGWEAPRSAWGVRMKAAVALCITAWGALVIGVSLFPNDVSGPTRLGVTATAGLGLIAALFPIIWMFVASLLAPLRDLRSATLRVGAGDYSTPVPPTTADELGGVVSGFNRLQSRIGLQLEELRASRARIIAASDAERRRVERNLHDGAQQRLVALTLELRMLEAKAKDSSDQELSEGIAAATDNLSHALGELRELARGLHPQILSTDGLKAALEQLGSRASVPVKVEAPDGRFPDSVESTAYFVVSEALANVGKYAEASSAEVSVAQRDANLLVEVADDGVGGADLNSGSGLSGLKDRVAALDGKLEVESAPGSGTKVRAELPLQTTSSEGGG